MENIPLSIIIIFLLGQIAYIVAHICSKFPLKILVLLQSVIFVFSGLMWAGHTPNFDDLSAPLMAHILSVVLAHWFLIFVFICGILVVLQEKSLKLHKNSAGLAPLQSIENAQFKMLTLAFGAMISAVLFGEWHLYMTYQVWWMLNAKIILSLALCAGIAGVLIMHQKWGTRGQKTARFILFSYFVFILVLGISHLS